jgi:hypothetical protein
VSADEHTRAERAYDAINRMWTVAGRPDVSGTCLAPRSRASALACLRKTRPPLNATLRCLPKTQVLRASTAFQGPCIKSFSITLA